MSIERVAFVGSKALGASVLEAMYSIAPQVLTGAVTFDDTTDIRCALGRFQEFAQRTGKPLHVLQKGSELKNAIAQHRPELCIVVGWYWVLKSELLSMVPNGWLGMHGSLLPKYRGGAPLVWAIINGERETGLSLFYFDEGMDTGDIVSQTKVGIDDSDTIADLLRKVEEASLRTIQQNYPLLLTGRAPRMKQDHSQATYAALRNPGDGRIDWRQSSATLYNFVRAQTHPYPGAFCSLGDKWLRVWSAEPFEYPYYGSHGQVVLVDAQSAVVSCGDGSGLRLRRVQLEGSEEQDAAGALKMGQRLA